MKSSAPWSVKGIERDARETAKEAAKREGMTVGEWLNQIIYTAGSPEDSDGNIEGLKLRDIVTAVEHLNKRTSDAETKNVEAIGDLTRNIGSMVERVQRLERVKPAKGSSDDITARLEKLELAGGDRQRIEALKALEKAVAQIAAQFSTTHKVSLERLDENERQLKELSARLETTGTSDDSGTKFLKEAIEGLTSRITRAERIANEAAELKEQANGSIDATFVERTGERLRVLGDEIKRGGDHIRDFEGLISKLSAQIDAAERRSAEGVQKVSDTVAELRQQVSDQTLEQIITEPDQLLEETAPEETDNASENSLTVDELNTESFTHQSVVDDIKNQIEAKIVASSTDAEAALEEVLASDDDAGTELEGDSKLEALDPDEIAAVFSKDALNEDETDSDPFGFNDELEAAFEDSEDDTTDAVDDFSFDLDDDEAEGSKDAKALLSEIQDVFSTTEATEENQDNDSTASFESAEDAVDQTLDSTISETSLDEDLDAILANFDDATDDADNETTADETSATDDAVEPETQMAAKPLLFDNTPSISKEVSDETETSSDATVTDEPEAEFLQAAHRRTKLDMPSDEAPTTDNTDKAATPESKKPRRVLTPKQKAILAARARQKRLAVARELAAKNPPPLTNKAETVKSALTSAPADAPQSTASTEVNSGANTVSSEATPKSAGTDEDEDNTENALVSGVKAFVSKLPFIGKAEEEDDEDNLAEHETTQSLKGTKSKSTPVSEPASIEDNNEAHTLKAETANDTASSDEPETNRALFDKIKANASAKPVTWALGVAILLAVFVLFLSVKDLVTKSPGNSASRPAATVNTPTDQTSETPTTVAVPDASTITENVIDEASEATTTQAEVTDTTPQIPAPPSVDPQALYMESMNALNGASGAEQTSAAIATLQEAAALGHPPAQLQLGELYKNGQGIDQDLGQARTWFRRSANGGNVLAMHRIGVMTARGDGGPADTVAAINWFEQAANRGLVDSQYNLGAIYHPTESANNSATQDAGKAYKWYSLAANNGDTQAKSLADGVAGALSPAQREDLDRQVANWKELPTEAVANEMAPTVN